MSSLRILVAGSSGFLGTHLKNELVERRHAVTSLVRRPTSAPDESAWDPYSGTYDRAAIEQSDVVINLAGSPTAGNPHSGKWARDMRESRVTTTRVLAEAIASSDRKPAFLSGNGISYYGDHGDAVVTEASDSRSDAFLTALAREWQAAAEPAAEEGARLCVLRTAPAMDRRSAPLKQLRLLFLAGLGGRLGRGEQRMPMVSLNDWVRAVTHLAEHPSASGPFNICCPLTPTNAEFTKALAEALHRPAFATAPAPLLKVAAGRLSSELLGSLNVRPAALEAIGFEFRDREVHGVVRSGLTPRPVSAPA